MSKRIRWLLPLVGVLLFVWVFRKVDRSALLGVMVDAEWVWLVIGMGTCLVVFLLKSIRHLFVLHCQGIRVPIRIALQAYFQSSFWGFLSPGRMGELSKVAYLREYGNGAQLAANVMIDRLLDLVAVLLFLGATAFVIEVPGKKTMLLVIGGCIAGAGLGTLIIKRVLGEKREGAGLARSFLQEILHVRNKPALLLFTLGCWGLNYFGMLLLYRSLGDGLSYPFIAFCVAASNLIAVLPISIAGIGPRENLLVYLFGLVGISRETAIAYSLTFVLIALMYVAVSYIWILVGMRGSYHYAKDPA